MKRLVTSPRNNWEQIVLDQGLKWYETEDGKYWDESCYYQFSMPEILQLEVSTNELQRLCLQAVDHIIENNRFDELHIDKKFIPAIKRSWDKDMPISIYGRFDLGYDPDTNQIKMFEYNADTPTSLVEAAVIQWHWKNDKFASCDQFNSIHERLVAAWQRQIQATNIDHFHLACSPSAEDETTISYMGVCIDQAGGSCVAMHIDDIGWDSKRSRFVDLDDSTIYAAFKLYPYEWMVGEEFGPHMLETHTLWIEPYWKMILSNKGILPILWELNPGHPLLLPAYFSEQKSGSWVKKPIFSREGANIEMSKNGQTVASTQGLYGDGPCIWQKTFDIKTFDGHYPVIGSWIVDGESAGMGIRESQNVITDNFSRFIPHVIKD